MSIVVHARTSKMPELCYKQLKAITMFQEIFRLRRHTVSSLNSSSRIIYSTLVSISNNINSNYINGVINVESYKRFMERAGDITNQYSSLTLPVTIRSLSKDSSIHYKLSYLHYQLTELVKLCGASSCHDVFQLFVGCDWDLGINSSHERLLNLYNTMFVPVSVRLSIIETHELRVLKYASFTESLVLKIHGAEIVVPFYNKTLTIKGYFRDDPLNTARVGGTLYDKYAYLVENVTDKYKDNSDFVTKYIEQISLRDFVALDHNSLMALIANDITELKKLKGKPRGYIVEEFLKATPKRQYNMLTLLLLDTSVHEHALSIITTLMSQPGSDTIDNVYRILHWSVQKIFDKLIENMDSTTNININIGIDENVLPYEKRIENMKCTHAIKKKALEKLKEIKNSKDGNEKVTKYLDGLLRIPFGHYRREKITRFLTEFVDEIDQVECSLKDYLHNNNMTDVGGARVACDEDNLDASKMHEFLVSISDKFSTHHSENDIDNLLNTVVEHKEHLVDDSDASQKILSLYNKWNGFKHDRKEYLNYVSDVLSNCIYGQDDAKRNIEAIIAQWINGEMNGVVFGFQGFPGTGKTTLAKAGIAKCLVDEDGKSRPFYFIPLGGARGGSMLLGHGYTYVGSQAGKLAECVQDAKIMNPILYFDELDKVSGTPDGDEIIRILTHLLDPEQNDHIEDRYFGVEMDLSKALIILSYNDSSNIDSILMDRIHEVKFKQYNKKDKVHIASKYILPRVLKSIRYTSDTIIFDDEILGYIVENYTYEAGVRDMKDKLTDITREINLRRIYNENEYQIPYVVSKELVDDILKLRNKINITEIPTKSQIGWVNGLYATTMGTGGITVIQVFNTPSDQKYSLELTGKLGDVMKESVKCAKTISWGIFNKDARNVINEEWRENALHIHFPAAGTSKDGPSAGAAITTAIISYFSKLQVRNYIAMTGEIDLYGNVRPIGGLQCKIEGAQRAGVKLILIPRANEVEYNEFKNEYGISVFAVDNISQVVRTCLIGSENYGFTYQHSVDDKQTNLILSRIEELDNEIVSIH